MKSSQTSVRQSCAALSLSQHLGSRDRRALLDFLHCSKRSSARDLVLVLDLDDMRRRRRPLPRQVGPRLKNSGPAAGPEVGGLCREHTCIFFSGTLAVRLMK